MGYNKAMKAIFMMGAGYPPPFRLCSDIDSQSLIDATDYLVVAEALEEGVPWPWANEIHLPPLLPEDDCLAHHSCTVGSGLQGRADLVLLRGGLTAE